VHDGESGAAEANRGAYAIIVLDITMPRMSSVETLRRIRAISRHGSTAQRLPTSLRLA
jgi:DNA-binding response OmpR family regulator